MCLRIPLNVTGDSGIVTDGGSGIVTGIAANVTEAGVARIDCSLGLGFLVFGSF